LKKNYTALLGAILLLIGLFAGCRAEVGAPMATPPPEVSETPGLPEQTEAPEQPEPTVPEDIEEPTVPEDDEVEDFASPRTPVTGILDASGLAWDSIYVTDYFSRATHQLSAEDAEETIRILTTMGAEEVLTPHHREGQHSDPRFTLEIRTGDTLVANILTTESGQHFFRFTGTYSDTGDPGYVIGVSEALGALLASYF